MACIVVTAYFLWPIEDPKLIGVLSGLLTGFVLLLIGTVTQVALFRQVDKYNRMGIIGLLENRHNQAYYTPLLAQAKRSIKLTGSSASRFLADFLDEDADTHVLLEALRKNKKLSVSILIPAEEYMSDNSRRNWQNQSALVANLRTKFPEQFDLRHFQGKAHQSFIVIDEGDFIGGPVLEGESRHSPALHVAGKTAYARKHNEFFDAQWQSSE